MCPFFLNKKVQEKEYAEGDLYKIVCVHGQTFPLYYGYYDECERTNPYADPMPIYPDFLKEPRFTDTGQPFVTKMQDACRRYIGVAGENRECAECVWYQHGDELLGVCGCPENRLDIRSKESGEGHDR